MVERFLVNANNSSTLAAVSPCKLDDSSFPCGDNKIAASALMRLPWLANTDDIVSCSPVATARLKPKSALSNDKLWFSWSLRFDNISTKILEPILRFWVCCWRKSRWVALNTNKAVVNCIKVSINRKAIISRLRKLVGMLSRDIACLRVTTKAARWRRWFILVFNINAKR